MAGERGEVYPVVGEEEEEKGGNIRWEEHGEQ